MFIGPSPDDDADGDDPERSPFNYSTNIICLKFRRWFINQLTANEASNDEQQEQQQHSQAALWAFRVDTYQVAGNIVRPPRQALNIRNNEPIVSFCCPSPLLSTPFLPISVCSHYNHVWSVEVVAECSQSNRPVNLHLSVIKFNFLEKGEDKQVDD